MAILQDSRQVAQREKLDQLTTDSKYTSTNTEGKRANESQVDNLLQSVNSEVTPPLRLMPTDPTEDLIVNLNASVLTNPQTGKKRTVPPFNDSLDRAVTNFTGATFTVDSSTGGGNLGITNSAGTNPSFAMGDNHYIKCLVQMVDDGTIDLKVGAQGTTNDGSATDATVPTPDDNRLVIGFFIIQTVSGNTQTIGFGDIYQFSPPIDTSGGGIDLTAFTSNIIPDTDDTYDFGSSSKSVHIIYVNTDGIVIGDGQIKQDTVLKAKDSAAGDFYNLNPRPTITAKTANYTITDAESFNHIFTNSGATGQVVFTLPTAAAGKTVTFINVAGEELIIEAASGDNITVIDQSGLTAINSFSSGHVVKLTALDATTWYAEYVEDNWENAYGRALFMGGYTVGRTNVVEYVDMTSDSNAVDFGDLSAATSKLNESGCSSTVRALVGGGDASGYTNVISYFTFDTLSNYTDFGDLTVARRTMGGYSSSVKGVFNGGEDFYGYVNTIDSVTLASAGNSADFGDTTVARALLASFSSSTRGINAGGIIDSSDNMSNVIDYTSIVSGGNAIDFGDLVTEALGYVSGCSSPIIGVICGGNTGTPSFNNRDRIQYITIATTGSATDIADLSAAKTQGTCVSSTIKGLYAGGGTTTGIIDVIEKFYFSNLQDATDFGDLTTSKREMAGASNTHGGLAS